MLQVLENLKQVRPELMQDRLQEMLGDKKITSPLRKSEPDRSILSRTEVKGEDERKLVTEPVSPRTVRNLTKKEEIIRGEELSFPLDPRMNKVSTKDQEVNALRDSIDREWDALKKEKDDLQKMKEEFEREKADFEKAKAVQSARSQSDSASEKLAEVGKKEAYTARNRNQMLDAVRESQSEQIDEERGRRVRQKTMSKDHSKDGVPLSGTQESLHSHRTEMIQGSPNRHKCHGHSPETIKSVSNYRKKEGNSNRLSGS